MKTRITIALAAFTLVACLTDQMTKDVAGVTYAAQQQACIDKYADRASIDACRDRVKREWATADAGADAREGGAR